MGRTQHCRVCNGGQSKYKCPSCLLPYCSLICFKKHKEVPCKKPSPPETSPPEEKPAPLGIPSRSYVVEEQKMVLQTETFQAIVESDGIMAALKNEWLQKLICQIDCSADPEAELDKALEEPMFHEFTDKILSIVNPQE